MRAKGIFCLEGLWDLNLKNRSSVLPMLELLESRERIPHIHRDCATAGEIEFFIKRWTQATYVRYPILYFAFHGTPGAIYVGQNDEMSLEQLAACFPRHKKSIVIFGSCSTVAVRKPRLTKFLAQTGAIAVCGYKTDVDWLPSAAFELLLLHAIQQNEFSGKGIKAIVRKATNEARRFKELGFRIVSKYS